MQKIELYRYENSDGSITVTPIKRNESDIVHKYRLVADEGMMLVNGDKVATVIDVLPSEVDLWSEEGTEATIEDYQNVLREVGVLTNDN